MCVYMCVYLCVCVCVLCVCVCVRCSLICPSNHLGTVVTPPLQLGLDGSQFMLLLYSAMHLCFSHLPQDGRTILTLDCKGKEWEEGGNRREWVG